jgi:hypothetical protein
MTVGWRTEAGFSTDRPAEAGDLSDLFYGMDDAFEEIDVRDGEDSVRISLGRLPRQRVPIVMAVGPVLHLDDLLGSKVCALATRAQVRDFIDVAAALARGYDQGRLLTVGREHDSGLLEEDFVEAMRRLDALPDAAFAQYGFGRDDVARLRTCFADWSRETAE